MFLQTTQATTWITIGNGNWSDSSIWMSGIVPSYSNSDTIIIKDTVTFDEDIFLTSGALMQIDSLGGALCGHHNITVITGGRLNKYGALNLDTLFIKGGIAHFIIGGPFLMWLTQVTDGGSFQLSVLTQTCLCSWDTCFIPIRNTILPEDTVIKNEYNIFPNPSNGNFNLEYSQSYESTFYFYNVLGQIIFSTTLDGTSGSKNFMNDNLNVGMYYWEARSGNTIHQTGKHIIIK